MQRLTHDTFAHVVDKRGRTLWGQVGTLRACYQERVEAATRYGWKQPLPWPQWLADAIRRQDGDAYHAFVIQRTSVICNDPSFYERRRAEQATSVLLTDGETVDVDGVPMRVRVIGDYSDMVKLYPVE